MSRIRCQRSAIQRELSDCRTGFGSGAKVKRCRSCQVLEEAVLPAVAIKAFKL